LRFKKSVPSKDRVTLDRAFSKLGLCSRTDATQIIRSGKVTVNGKVIREAEHWVSMREDRVGFEGRHLKPRKRLVLMLNKPTGVVTTHRDSQNRRTVYDLLTGINDWIFPVGRLDKDTSGLLLLTNDTKLGEALTNPGAKVPKTYLVKVNFHPSPEQLRNLENGILLKDGEITLPADVRLLRQSEKCSFLELVIVEGKNRQVRRMIETLGGQVLKLVRTQIGGLVLGNLPPGGYRVLNNDDLVTLWGRNSRR
jgi:23S rRNA pseudouridine2605 synthase